MKIRQVLFAAATCFVSTVAIAQDYFYSQNISGWNISGIPQVGELHPVCRANKNFDDGSQFSVIKDLADGELYMFLQNMGWNISDAPGVYTLRMNFHKGSRITGSNIQFELLNKNTIRIRNLNSDRFINDFMDYSKLVFVMPGTINNAEILLNGSTNATVALSDCVKNSKNMKPRAKGMDL